MAWQTPIAEREAAWAATRALVRIMSESGVRHHDLNVKNVLIAPSEGGLRAHLLDVDRVTFGAPGSEAVARGNVERLLRSARKWRERHGAEFDERELAELLERETA
jgi:aminoglycoside phosphotransferase (APT) family kinase protein